MARMLFFINIFNTYTVPRNPTTIDPVDEEYIMWKGGLNIGNRMKRRYDNRERTLVWENLPAIPEYIEMIHRFENYLYEPYLLVNLGNGIASGIYAGDTTTDYHQINVVNVETKIDDGNSAYFSGGTSYNVFSKVTLRYQDMGAII